MNPLNYILIIGILIIIAIAIIKINKKDKTITLNAEKDISNVTESSYNILLKKTSMSMLKKI